MTLADTSGRSRTNYTGETSAARPPGAGLVISIVPLGGVDDEVTRWGDPVPPMFWLRDPDGNSHVVVQPSSWTGRGQSPPRLLYALTRRSGKVEEVSCGEAACCLPTRCALVRRR